MCRHSTAPGSLLKSAAAGCEPVPAFPLLPGPSTCPAWPSAASISARCEPVPAFPLLPRPPTCPARPSVTDATSRCEPLPAFPLSPGPPTCPAWPSPASAASRCEPFPTNRLTPSSRDSGIPARHYGSGRREQAASCDAFVLSRRQLAPDAPPSRTSPLCLIAKPFPEPARPSPPPRKNLRNHRRNPPRPRKICKKP